jgi:hypothetical protein
MKYKIKYSHGWRSKTALVSGHRYEQNIDKMILFFPDGSLREVPCWSKRTVWLGLDWVAAQKNELEKRAAIPVILKTEES